MRCLTLADELRANGAQCVFLCREHRGNLITALRQRGFTVEVVPIGLEDEIPLRGDAELLIANQSAVHLDAEFASKILAPWHPDWLVVDHYGIDVEWERRVCRSARRLMVIDDLANRNHDCALLLDQNLVADVDERYQGLVPNRCRLLLGPSYALLQPQYLVQRLKQRERGGKVRRVLVYFGGGDRYNVTGMVVDAFLRLNPAEVDMDIVVNSTNPHIPEIESKVTGRRGLTLYSDLPSLASLMDAADLAFGAGGATTWERCCLGLPSVVITLANNQIQIASELNRRGVIQWLGRHEEVPSLKIQQVLDKALREEVSEAWVESSRKVVDGHGTKRVANLLRLENWD